MTIMNLSHNLVHSGQATIPFASWLGEDSVAVIGQTTMSATAKVQRSLVADNDDVYAQDWLPPLVMDIIAGVGFTLLLRTAQGSFKGPVKINWSWIN
jgi:uncharacterized protein (DUF697 family)